MPDCSDEKLSFSKAGCRKVEGDFKGGRLTSDGGALLLREADRQLGLTEALSSGIPDSRDERYTKHTQREMLAQRIFGIALGYPDLNDHDELRRDPALQVAAEQEPDPEEELASAPTLCRLADRINRDALWRMAEVPVESFIASRPAPPQRLVLDFDATDDPVFGQQEGRFFHGYYDEYCFLPLYVHCGDWLLVAYLRSAGRDPALHSRAILKMLVRRFRREWPEVQIVVRGDSDFSRPRIMRWCERNDVTYILGLRSNAVLKRKSAGWIEQVREGLELTGRPQRIFEDFQYAAGSWETERRVIAKAEYNHEGPNRRFVVTNLDGPARRLYQDVYCARGEMENRIKEHQLGLFADRTSCQRFLGNQFRLLLAAAAYVLVQQLRAMLLAGTELARAQVRTIREKLFKIGARVRCSVRRIVFHFAGGYPLKGLLRRIAANLPGGPDPPASPVAS